MSIAEPTAVVLPTHLDLPDSDGQPVDNYFQPFQTMLLTGCLTPVLDRLHPQGDYSIGSNSGIYWKITEKPLDGVKVPDWFYVAHVPKLLDGILRRSYVLLQERVHPVIVIEFVSDDGARERDATPGTGKFWVYEQVIKPRFYVIHDPDREELTVFELLGGKFKPLSATAEGRFRIDPMGIDLGIWDGLYQACPAPWLRAWDWNGNLILTPEERVEQERTRAEQEHSRAEHEQRRAEKLAERLRQLGVDPDTV